MRKNHFQFRLYITYSVIISFILATALFLFYRYNSSLMKENLERTTVESLDLTKSRIDAMFVDMDRQLKQLHASAYFMNLVKELQEKDNVENYFSKNAMKASELRECFLAILVTRSPTDCISYVSNNYNNLHASVATQKQYSVSNELLRGIPDFESASDSNAYQQYLPPHANYWDEDKNVVSVLRPVSDMFQTYGVLEYDCPVEEFDKVLSFAGDNELFNLYLFDNSGKLLHTTDTENYDLKLLQEKLNLEEKASYYYTEQDKILAYGKSELTGWTVLLSRDTKGEAMEQRNLLLMICLIFFASTVLILMLLYYVTRRLTLPLQQLRNNLQEQNLQSTIRLEIPESSDEVVMLANTMETMLNKMHNQNQLLIETKERAQKAHMDAMEAQLNPHFLYNTLSIIGAYGMESGNRTVMQMCTELANILRYSITYTNENVPLSYELDNIRDYLHIMKMRHEHMLEYSWDLDPSVENVPVPKLILQPIIENCFQHGFHNVLPVWKIEVRSWKTDDFWYISIKNNGNTFAPGKVQYLEKRLSEFQNSFYDSDITWERSGKQGYGLENTMIRMNIYYKGKEHFRIVSEDGLTTIELGGMLHCED